MYSNNRDDYRQAFFVAWNKHKKGLPLEAVEVQLVDVLMLHPEYHALLEHPEIYQKQEFSLEENPFFHLSLHLSVREQVRMNRPLGIQGIYAALLKHHDAQTAEHRMMECLAQTMWQAQQVGGVPDEEDYLQKLRQLVPP